MTPDERGLVLLREAWHAIDAAVLGRASPTSSIEGFEAHGASFVTLEHAGALRGCLGTLQAWRPVIDDVRANARAAALRDPRFPPVTPGELAALEIEVAELGAPRDFEVASEAAACARLRPGRDGVILRHRDRQATFLPKVWEKLPDPAAFLAALKRKAGFQHDHWDREIRLWRYTVRAWRGGRVS